MSIFTRKTNTENNEQSKSEADELLAKFASLVDEKIKPVSEKVDSLTTDWSKMKADAEAQAADEARRAAESELTDDQKAARQAAAEKQGMLQLIIQTKAQRIEDRALAKVDANWPELHDAIEKLFSEVKVEAKAQENYPQLCERIIQMEVGRAAMSGGLRYDKSGKRFMIETEGGSSDADPNDILTNGEFDWIDLNGKFRASALEQLKKIGVTEEQFRKQLKDGTLVV